MQRRTLLKLGIGSAALLALVGGGVAWLQPGIEAGRLTPSGRMLFTAAARAVLDGALPVETAARRRALTAHLERLDATIAAFPAATRAELSQLIALLSAPPGRLVFAGLATNWEHANDEDLQASLRSMRDSTIALRQQAYHALRDLTNAAYFSDPETWGPLGYPGPRPV